MGDQAQRVGVEENAAGGGHESQASGDNQLTAPAITEAAVKQEPADWVLSNQDLVEEIFCHLGRMAGLADICRCALVCRAWRDVADGDDFWSHIDCTAMKGLSRDQVNILPYVHY